MNKNIKKNKNKNYTNFNRNKNKHENQIRTILIITLKQPNLTFSANLERYLQEC